MATLVNSRVAHTNVIGGTVARIAGIVSAWNEARATRKVLGQLTDRELEDIGVARGDIKSIAARA